MNYQKIHNDIIARAQGRIKGEQYYEEHHITPRSLGGTDDKENLVLLTPEEHYLVHQLLVKLNPTCRSLIWAAHMMCSKTNLQHRNNKSFGWLRRKMAENGKKHTTESKEKMRESAKKRKPMSAETRAKMSASRMGNTNSKGNVPWNLGKRKENI